jgi:preprotein translocase subunit SecF
MMHIIRPGTKYDFLGTSKLWLTVSAVTFALALLVLLVKGFNFGLDFAGGHEILLSFDTAVQPEDVRTRLEKLFPGVDTSVQRFEVPTEPNKHFFLTRIQRSETFGAEQIKTMNDLFTTKYGAAFKRLRYNPEAGDVVEVEFVAGSTRGVDLSAAALSSVVAGANHEVRQVRTVGRPDQLRWEVVLKGVDSAVIKSMLELDGTAKIVRVEFVGPTAGRELRDQGLLAILYTLLCLMIYIAVRFDFYYAPGAIVCLFHDAVVVTGALILVGEQFTLTTIAGLMTLVGYSINDTIVVFDRIRETIGKAHGEALKEILNKAINETLGRTIMTSSTVLLSSVCLMVFGRDTVLAHFGLIMFLGIIFGTYSSIYVATPVFYWLKIRFGDKVAVPAKKGPGTKKEALSV